MRRIADIIGRNPKRCLAEKNVRESSPSVSIPSNLVYHLSRYDRRMGIMYGFGGPCPGDVPNILVPWKKSYERKVRYEERAAFDMDVGPFVNLESLEVRNSRLFDPSVLNGTRVKRLKLHRVSRVVAAETLVHSSLQEIVLGELVISYRSLRRILSAPSLISVSLESVEVLECQDWEAQLIDDLKGISRLRKVRMINMGVDPSKFINFCIPRALTYFLISDTSRYAKVRVGGVSTDMLRTKNALENLHPLCLDSVESVHIKGTDVKHVVGMRFPLLKSLFMEQVVIDFGIFRGFYMKQPELVRLGFIECVFDHVSFYEIISHFRVSLMYLDLRLSNLPHDYVSYLQSKLVFCFVVLKNGESMVIDNNTGRRLRTESRGEDVRFWYSSV